MDFLKSIFNILPQIAAVLVILVAGGGYVVRLFNKDTKEEKSDVVSSANTIMEFWKNQAEEYKVIGDEKDKRHSEKIAELTKDFTAQITALTREVGELKGQLTAESIQKKEYLAILQNRDPETKKFMEIMLKAEEDHDASHKEMMEVLSQIHKMTKDEHDRDFKIVSTVTKAEPK